jgi:hypothetical protein
MRRKKKPDPNVNYCYLVSGYVTTTDSPDLGTVFATDLTFVGSPPTYEQVFFFASRALRKQDERVIGIFDPFVLDSWISRN